jgi:hypothetical protein
MKNDSQQGHHAVRQQYDRREIQNHNQENFLDKIQQTPTTTTTTTITQAIKTSEETEANNSYQ